MVRLQRFFSLFVATLCVALPSAAQETQRFEIRSQEKIVGATGIYLPKAEPLLTTRAKETKSKGQDFSSKRDAQVTKGAEDSWIIEVTLHPKDKQEGALLTAIANTESGKTLPAPVRALHKSGNKIPPEKALCGDDVYLKELKKIVKKDKAAHQALVEIRKTKQEVLFQELKKLLSFEKLEQLHKTEKSVGISHEKPLSLSLSLEELAYRVGPLMLSPAAPAKTVAKTV